MLSAHSLTKSFDDRAVISNISIDIAPGQITSILGPSGGGKSTLLRILALLDKPDSGAVTLDGHTPDASTAPGPIWPEITIVFQQHFLWPHLSLRENVFLPHLSTSKVALHLRAAELFERLELTPLQNRVPWQLSQGERARAALARALLLEPRYLLLDEATAALDSERSTTVGELLRQAATTGTGIALVTHDLPFAYGWSDRILRLERGILVEDHTPWIAHGDTTTPRRSTPERMRS